MASDASSPLLTAQNIITKPIASLSAMFFIYGVYCVVFGLSVHTLLRLKSPAHKLYKGCSGALFALATLYVAVYTWGICRQTFVEFQAATTKDFTAFDQFSRGDDQKSATVGITWFISTFMNSIADTMLIHRCYVVFNSNKLVLYPLAFVAFVLNGLDFAYNVAYMAGYGGSSKAINAPFLAKILPVDKGAVIGIVIFQIILTLMTGGRIWWITREARDLAAKRPAETGSAHSRFQDMVAIIVESALLYAGILLTGVLLQDVAWDPDMPSIRPVDFPVISTLISGLAPTLVIVRVAYGRSVDSVEQTLSTFRIADAQPSQQRTTVIRPATIDLHVQSHLNSSDLQEDSERQSANSVPNEKS